MHLYGGAEPLNVFSFRRMLRSGQALAIGDAQMIQAGKS
jgi:hypothetical protein